MMRKKIDIVHELDPTEIDELDEISGDEQLVNIWCNTCNKYEWRSILIEDIGSEDFILTTESTT